MFNSKICLIFKASIYSIISILINDLIYNRIYNLGKTGIGSVAGFIIGLGIIVTIISFVGSTGMFRESRSTILTVSFLIVFDFLKKI